MDLKKFLPNAKNSEDEEFYWSLIIEPGWVQAGIWKIVDKAAQVIYSSQPVVWGEESELVSACDTVLSSAIQDFPEDSQEPTKTVFGVSYSWITDGEIASEHLGKIKKICTELSLSPVGFVVMAEAITHLIKSETGTPSNSIVLGVYKENLELSLFEKGKLNGTTQIARSVSLMDDVVEGLTRLSTGEMLPSTILVYDGREGDLEEARQDLLKVDWENYKEIKFLHSPKVEIVESDRKVFAVSLAGASELAGITSLVPKTVPEVKEDKDPVMHDIEKGGEEKEEEMAVEPEDLGFTVEEESFDEPKDVGVDSENELTSEEDIGMMETNVSAVDDMEKDSKKSKLKMPPVGKKMGELVGKIPKFSFNLSFASKGLHPFSWGFGFLILVLILFGLFWWFVPRASVTIFLSPRKLEENIDLVVDTQISESDIGAMKVPGKMVEVSVSGEKTADTTGNKTVGDKATGEATIYRAGPQISLPSGTLLNGPGGLKFAIEGSVSVASGSALTPGKTNVSVTAENIGSEYNLASGTTFTVGNYSSGDMEAKNDSSFSGGSSREIQAVAKSDLEGLLDDLKTELFEKAQNELSQNLSDSDFLIAESVESIEETSDYNHKVGDEADSVKLTLNMKVSAIVVNKQDLTKISEEILNSRVSSGFSLDGNQINYSFDDVNKENGLYSFNTKIVANLLPDVNDEEVKSKIKGRQIQIAKDYLQTAIPAFTRVEIKIKPSFPGKLKTLPHVEKNIEVEFSAER